MNKPIITLCSTLLLTAGSTLFAQNENRQGGQRGNRERPDFFALADKDESGTVTLDELVNSRIEMMGRRGGQGGGQRGGQGGGQGGQGGAQRGGQGGGDPAEMAARVKKGMAEAFKKADKDENGELTKEEFAAMPQGPAGGRGGRGGGQGGQRPNRGGGGDA